MRGQRGAIQGAKDRQMIGEVADQVDLGIGDLVVGFGGRDHRVDQRFLRAQHGGLLRGHSNAGRLYPGLA